MGGGREQAAFPLTPALSRQERDRRPALTLAISCQERGGRPALTLSLSQREREGRPAPPDRQLERTGPGVAVTAITRLVAGLEPLVALLRGAVRPGLRGHPTA